VNQLTQPGHRTQLALSILKLHTQQQVVRFYRRTHSLDTARAIARTHLDGSIGRLTNDRQIDIYLSRKVISHYFSATVIMFVTKLELWPEEHLCLSLIGNKTFAVNHLLQ
jgi:hypothetical protein